jgi:PPOX class probable F420-dependent enzyme
MLRLTEEQIRLLSGRHFATVATLMPDGSPHASVVWIDTDGEYIYFNTAAPVKSRNLRRDNRVAITVVNPSNPYEEALAIRGRAELISEGANEFMDELSRKYTGHAFDGFRRGEQRMIVKVTPEHLH